MGPSKEKKTKIVFRSLSSNGSKSKVDDLDSQSGSVDMALDDKVMESPMNQVRRGSNLSIGF